MCRRKLNDITRRWHTKLSDSGGLPVVDIQELCHCNVHSENPNAPHISSFTFSFYSHAHETDKRLPFGYARSLGTMAQHACHKGEEEERMQSGLISLQEAALRRARLVKHIVMLVQWGC